MRRVEPVADDLESSAVGALPPPIEPDGGQSQQRESLLDQLHLETGDGDFIEVPAQEPDMQEVQTRPRRNNPA